VKFFARAPFLTASNNGLRGISAGTDGIGRAHRGYPDGARSVSL
jgi:hypothetical protein